MKRSIASRCIVAFGAVFSVAGCSATTDGLGEPGGSVGEGGSTGAGGSTAAGGASGSISAGGASGSISAGGASGSTGAGGASGSTGAGGASGSISAGGAGGSTGVGGAGGSTGVGGAGGSTSAGGASGAGGAAGADSGAVGAAGAPPVLAPNAISAVVNAGPAAPQLAFVNGLFAAVTVCVPGTDACQTIEGLLVDTASSGIRVPASVLTLSLPQEGDASGNPTAECAKFADGSFMWGPVARADIRMSGERASSVPIQIAADPASSFPAPPAACTSAGGTNLGTPGGFAANGILGVGFYAQDCGSACVGSTSPGVYFRCVSSTCTANRLALASQVTNPVYAFAADNNGVVISLPAVPPEGSASVSGTLTFGIGTQTNNGLGGATVFPINANGYLATAFEGQSYTATLFDSGSNAMFFLSPSALSVPSCQRNTSFYCPTTTLALTASVSGARGASATVAFSVANADSLLVADRFAFSDLAGPAPSGVFSWGLPFFFGRAVFTAFEGRSTPRGAGPYWAY